MSKKKDAAVLRHPNGLVRVCDCGCRRPALFIVREVDLAFSMKCSMKYQACRAWAQSRALDPTKAGI